MEIYKDIKGYEGKYQITSWGRVYNVDRNVFLNPYVHFKGYLRIDLHGKNGKREHKKVHRFVADAFTPNPHGKLQVNHKDGNKKNNSVTNLEWVTNKENAEHRKMIHNLIRQIDTEHEYQGNV